MKILFSKGKKTRSCKANVEIRDEVLRVVVGVRVGYITLCELQLERGNIVGGCKAPVLLDEVVVGRWIRELGEKLECGSLEGLRRGSMISEF